MIKKLIKNLVSRSGPGMAAYNAASSFYHRTRKLTFFIFDARRALGDMRWDGPAGAAYWAKSSALLFQYHKLEKGLCIPGEKRFFGYDPASATLALLGDWRASGYATSDPIYRGALETIYAYRRRIDETPPVQISALKKALDDEIQLNSERYPELETPCRAALTARTGTFEWLESLAIDRRSVRSFTARKVDIQLIERAVKIAQLSPSACNRQPCRVHHYNERLVIDEMLALQNGNRGFGHTIQNLLVLTAEASSFFDASERHEPYIDGGLFAMTLLFAFQTQGISTCCLNWCVEPAQDKSAHVRGNIPTSERIIMYIAIGYADELALVPRSPRRQLSSAIIHHDRENRGPF